MTPSTNESIYINLIKPQANALFEDYKRLSSLIEQYDNMQAFSEKSVSIAKAILDLLKELSSRIQKFIAAEISVPVTHFEQFKKIRHTILQNFDLLTDRINRVADKHNNSTIKNEYAEIVSFLNCESNMYEEAIKNSFMIVLNDFIAEFNEYKPHLKHFISILDNDCKKMLPNLQKLLAYDVKTMFAGDNNTISERYKMAVVVRGARDELENNHFLKNMLRIHKPTIGHKILFTLNKWLSNLGQFLNPLNICKPKKFGYGTFWYGGTVSKYLQAKKFRNITTSVSDTMKHFSEHNDVKKLCALAIIQSEKKVEKNSPSKEVVIPRQVGIHA